MAECQLAFRARVPGNEVGFSHREQADNEPKDLLALNNGDS